MKDGAPSNELIARGNLKNGVDLRKHVIAELNKLDERIPVTSVWWRNEASKWVELTVDETTANPEEKVKVDPGSIELVVLTDAGKSNQGGTGEDVVHLCVIFLV
eukprot:GHVU01227281.1.p2 GENE.GHVU01227281.1~~GHVU01227281.1.p2  ORF type:complete len:104 (+),score=9.31 GHVU01227281.1:1037-1348(+)